MEYHTCSMEYHTYYVEYLYIKSAYRHVKRDRDHKRNVQRLVLRPHQFFLRITVIEFLK